MSVAIIASPAPINEALYGWTDSGVDRNSPAIPPQAPVMAASVSIGSFSESPNQRAPPNTTQMNNSDKIHSIKKSPP